MSPYQIMANSDAGFEVFHDQCDQIGQFFALWQPFIAVGNNYFTQIEHIVGQFLLRCQNQ